MAQARVLEEGITTLLTSQLGTVSHMPPELLTLGEKRLSKKVDVYALGVLLFEALTGELPFRGMLFPQIVIYIAGGQRLKLHGPHVYAIGSGS